MKRRTNFERVLPLNLELEKAVLYAVMHGKMDIKNVNRLELSKLGQCIYGAIAGLGTGGTQAIKPKTVYLAATEVHNADGPEIKAYLKEIEQGEIPEIQAIHGALARKKVITTLVNEATDQVASGEYSLLALKGLLDAQTHSRNTLIPLCEEMDGEVKPPEGMPIPCLPRITQATGGLFGVWLIG